MLAQGRGGCLLFNASKSAFNPGPGFGPYAVAKTALVALMRQYAVDLGAPGIRSNAVNADRIRTGLFAGGVAESRAKARGVSVDDYFSRTSSPRGHRGRRRRRLRLPRRGAARRPAASSRSTAATPRRSPDEAVSGVAQWNGVGVIDADWTTEALRLFHRYEEEVVLTYGLCPWAEPSRRNGTMRERVLLQTDESTKPSLAALASLDADESAEVAVLIYPRIGLGFTAFERFVASVRDEDAPMHPLGGIPFAMAAFHPDARADRSTAERLIPFLRRTPDPTIQIVRSAVLERVRSGAPQGTSFVDPATFDIAQTPQLPLQSASRRATSRRWKPSASTRSRSASTTSDATATRPTDASSHHRHQRPDLANDGAHLGVAQALDDPRLDLGDGGLVARLVAVLQGLLLVGRDLLVRGARLPHELGVGVVVLLEAVPEGVAARPVVTDDRCDLLEHLDDHLHELGVVVARASRTETSVQSTRMTMARVRRIIPGEYPSSRGSPASLAGWRARGGH